MSSFAPSDAQRAVFDSARLDLLDFSRPSTINQERERQEITRNFCSDTMTAPTPQMLEYALKAASLGDDVMGWDYCTNRLEEHVARLCGKEAGIFVSSGSMGNQLAIRALLGKPPYSVLSDHRAHNYTSEAGGTAFHSGATSIPVIPSNGKYITLEDVKSHIILSDDIHYATTQLITLENTLYGTIHPQSSIVEIADYAKKNGLKLHLDGARLWHVSVETGLSLKELCDPFDTISVCFSKGLGAPVGSMLVGPSDIITLVRRYRKLFGGAMRQIGFLSAAAAYSLSHHLPLLPGVHQKAKRLAAGMESLGIRITVPVETCMVFFDPSPIGLTTEEIAAKGEALDKPIKMFGGDRLAVHIQTTDEAIDDLLALISSMAKGSQGALSKKASSKTPYPAKL